MELSEQDLAPYRDMKGVLSLTKLPGAKWVSTWGEGRPSWLDLGDDRKARSNAAAVKALKIVTLLAFTRDAPPIKPGRQWAAICHQAGGLGCLGKSFLGTPLAVRPKVSTHLLAMARRWYCRHGGNFDVARSALSDIPEYQAELKAAGLQCEHTLPLLLESVYPIDATPENLRAICTDVGNVSDVIDGPLPASDAPNVAILVITRNSD